MFDRLPTPFGLVRFGVAPDHQKIKSVTAVFDKIASHPASASSATSTWGRTSPSPTSRAYYHQVLYTTGAQTDRPLGVPGEDLPGSHPATEFVAWYNGHPDYRDCRFDLSQERVGRRRRRQRGGRRGAHPVPHPGGAGPDRHRRLRAGGAAAQPGPRGVPARPPRARPRRRSPTPRSGSWASCPTPTSSALPEEVALDPLTRAALEQTPDRRHDQEGRDPPGATPGARRRGSPGAWSCASWSRRSSWSATPAAGSARCGSSGTS